MTLRATTNLVIPDHLQLPRTELKKNFMWLYNKGYTGPEPVMIARLWMSSVFPEVTDDPSFGKNSKGIRMWAQHAAKHLRAGYLKIQKVNDANDPHFVVSLPLADMNPHALQSVALQYRGWFTDGKNVDNIESAEALTEQMKDTAEATEVKQRTIPAAEIIKNMKVLDAKGRAELSQCLLQIRIAIKGSVAVVFADFKISQAEAQQLTTTPWMQIRPIDLYPLLLQWVAGQFGYTVSTPLASFPISKIARTLPVTKPEDARVNEDGLAIDAKGLPYWLPRELNNTTRYEDLYSQVGDKGDGTFSLLDVASVSATLTIGEEVKVKLPANIPVLIDWTNNKYAFSLSTGMLKILDLSRYKAADAAHIRTLLKNTQVTDKYLAQVTSLASASGVLPTIHFLPNELAALSNEDASVADKMSDRGGIPMDDYLETAIQHFSEHVNSEIRFRDISTEGEAIFRPLARYMIQAHAAILANLDAVNTRFAVSTVSSVLGNLTLIAKYASDSAPIELAANKLCFAAANQNVKADWEPPSIPLLSDKIGFLPHQKKVRNLLKDSPDFAILPVQAGGGKSVLIITDILYEIKADRSQPYLILCPSHLVAQYVKEIVFFTSGKLNVVPINTDVIFRNGISRLTKLLDGAPRNTVVVCNYDVLAKSPQQICYGTSPVTVYPVIEFLRQFRFGYAALDESHSVKNDSQRTRACMTLIADIPKKRLASGTMAHDSPSDLAMQISMLDPTLFGSRDAFNARYGQEVKGNRVVKWRPGAQQAIMTVIKSRVVIGKAMRKEWAALLPQAEEKFHGVEMTETQHQVYTAILTEALDKMKADAKGNKTLQKFFESQATAVVPAKPQAGGDEGEDEEADEDAEEAADESAGAGIEAMLKFYLARLEQFLTAPVADALGDKLLKGDDRRSPKVNMIIKIMHEHISGNLPGKVLVFTNFIASAEAIYEALPPDLKRQALLYVAADKETTGSQFETDDSKKIMIGVENSMNTGLNLQHVSRLIRVETVWNPGTLEQGNSRVQRPELKKAERREKIYFDWVVANRTMDVTKISRLIAKVIAVGKFENADSEDYEAIPDVPIIPMNSNTIEAMNDWNLNLVEYADAYREYKQVQHADYTEYREIHGALSLEPVQVAAPPLDAKILASVPYPLGLELYKAGELGLIRVDEYLRQDFVEDEDAAPAEDDEGEGAEDLVNVQKQRLKEAYRSLIGKTVHTEFGDGIVKSAGVHGKYVNVLLPSGFLVRTKIAACFLVTKASKNTRAALIKAVGLPSVDPVAGIAGARFRIDNAGARRAAKQAEEEEKEAKKVKIIKKTSELSVELTFNVSNGFLGITYFADKKNPDAKAALQALGFRPVPEFALAHVKSALQLRKQFNVWHEAGFTLDEAYRKMNVSAAFLDMYNLLKSGKLARGTENFKFSTRNQLANFFRSEVKPSTSRNVFKPFPMIEDGEAYIVMHLRGQPANVRATKVRSPGIRWQEGGESLVFYGLDLAATGQKIKEIMASGIQIANEDEVRKHFRLLKKTKLRVGEQDKNLNI